MLWFSLENLSGLLFSEDAPGGQSGGLGRSYVGLGILVTRGGLEILLPAYLYKTSNITAVMKRIR